MPRRNPRNTPEVQPQLDLGESPSSIDTSTLRPGLLVGLKTSIRGNVSYEKEVIEPEHRIRNGALKETWQTERVVEDPEEHKKALKARMKARQIISSVCAKSAFGLLCPKASADKLEVAVRDARRVVALFNRSAKLTRVAVYVMKGEVAQDDVQAVRAIKSEVRDLLKIMSEGISNLNVEAVREAAGKARSIGAMLSPEAAGKINKAIETARAAARKIVKAGEAAAQQIDKEAIKTISQARTAFLDVDDDDVLADLPAPIHETRAVDTDPDAPDEPEASAELSEPVRRVRSPVKASPPKKGAAGKKAAGKPSKTARRVASARKADQARGVRVTA